MYAYLWLHVCLHVHICGHFVATMWTNSPTLSRMKNDTICTHIYIYIYLSIWHRHKHTHPHTQILLTFTHMHMFVGQICVQKMSTIVSTMFPMCQHEIAHSWMRSKESRWTSASCRTSTPKERWFGFGGPRSQDSRVLWMKIGENLGWFEYMLIKRVDGRETDLNVVLLGFDTAIWG